MISRYARKEMEQIWSDENRFKIWLEIETVALEAMVNEKKAPAEALKAVRERGGFSVARVLELEATIKHDVIAFLTNVAEIVGPEARCLHRGLTSSDVLDTALAIQLKQSGQLILEDIKRCLEVLKKKAYEHKNTACVGRSHGIHAEPTTFGLKLAGWYAELKRADVRLRSAIDEISYGKIAGAVGTYAALSPEFEKFVLTKLGLKPETVATQVVARDRHAHFFSALALAGCALERASVEIRHLQRTEVREVEEYFSPGQKGSSAMPHKRNPVLSENLCGLARLLRSYAQSSMENVALWHERDISHSSVERVIGPDACIVLDFMLNRFRGLIEGLVVYPERMQHNLELTRGLVFSGTLLIKLVDAGMTREDAYKVVQRHALPAWEGGATLEERILADSEVSKLLKPDEVKAVFNLGKHLQHVDQIFERTFV